MQYFILILILIHLLHDIYQNIIKKNKRYLFTFVVILYLVLYLLLKGLWSYGSWINLQLPMQSVPITSDVVSLKLDQGEVYIIMWFTTGLWFSPGPSTNKTDRHNINEIVLKVALNIITQTNKLSPSVYILPKMQRQF